MTFTAWYYPFFLILIGTIYWNVSQRSRLVLLLASSYFFYAYWDVRFLSLIIASTSMDYLCGRAIDGHRTTFKTLCIISLLPFLWLFGCSEIINQHNISAEIIICSIIGAGVFILVYSSLWSFQNGKRRRNFYLLSLAYNLCLLGFFKYFNFFSEQAIALLNTLGFQANEFTLSILLPVGISFYTFQSISYATDIYLKRENSCSNPLLFATFIAFFPQLVAGPIQRSHELLPQLEKKINYSSLHIESGIRLIIVGYFKKVFVGDNCAIVSNYFFSGSSDLNLGWIFLGALAFAFQIYGDFSGYSDIARGSAKILGIDLNRNFSFPYCARNPSDFWRRWHISLSSWIRDYIFIPLGGSSNNRLLTVRNLFVSMLLAGLWHGAAWNFLIWGFYHATLLTAYRYTPILNQSESSKGIRRYAYISLMFALTLIGWIIFRSENIHFIYNVASGIFIIKDLKSVAKPFIWLIIHITPLIILQYATRKDQDESMLANRSWKLQAIDYTVMLMLIASSTSPKQEFIYFQF